MTGTPARGRGSTDRVEIADIRTAVPLPQAKTITVDLAKVDFKIRLPLKGIVCRQVDRHLCRDPLSLAAIKYCDGATGLADVYDRVAAVHGDAHERVLEGVAAGSLPYSFVATTGHRRREIAKQSRVEGPSRETDGALVIRPSGKGSHPTGQRVGVAVHTEPSAEW
jgi:hypothetical protein